MNTESGAEICGRKMKQQKVMGQRRESEVAAKAVLWLRDRLHL